MILVQAELRRLHSPDISDFDSSGPRDPADCCVLIQAFFGPLGLPGEESFNILVCTPSWLNRKLKEIDVINARHHLVVSEFNLGLIKAYLERYASRCQGQSWDDVALKLSRLGRWEFEDYREFE